MAADGSPLGIRGISTNPAPRRPRALPIGDDVLLAVRTEAVRTDGTERPGAVATETACAVAGCGAVPQTSQ
jgi:hypothetical protein